ncbi:hypothetical protein VNO77_02396 [Canavalia gladiata]|uniref:Uncharacterized protein n=1 Tax=Canavalia gladiata TaxID=3824 RepID=A0AAN9MT76_CANGL
MPCATASNLVISSLSATSKKAVRVALKEIEPFNCTGGLTKEIEPSNCTGGLTKGLIKPSNCTGGHYCWEWYCGDGLHKALLQAGRDGTQGSLCSKPSYPNESIIGEIRTKGFKLNGISYLLIASLLFKDGNIKGTGKVEEEVNDSHVLPSWMFPRAIVFADYKCEQLQRMERVLDWLLKHG